MPTPAALVTGGATRLGRHFAEALADKGFDIALHVNSSRGEAEEVATVIRGKGRECEILSCDFLSDSPETLIQQAKARFPGLNVLLNSASAYEPAPIAQTDLAMLETQFRVNMFTPLLLTRHFSEVVERGQIINIIDNKVAYHQYPYAAYLLSKKSLADMTRMAALEFAPRLRINGIALASCCPHHSAPATMFSGASRVFLPITREAQRISYKLCTTCWTTTSWWARCCS